MKELRKLINENKEVKEVLKNCSDSFLLENQGIILAALSKIDVAEGYKVSLSINDDILEWQYIASSENTEYIEKKYSISKNYKYKLPEDWSEYYLIDLNDIKWTEDKRDLARVCKQILGNVDSKKSSKGFWLYGISNSGKSYASVALLNMLSQKGKSVAFVSISDLISRTQNSFNNSYQNSSSNIEKIKKTDYIVIDDLGSERPTPWFKENILLPIIDYRVKSNKTTIFTSNSSIGKYGNKLKYRSQNPEVEEDTNDKIITRIKDLISEEIRIG